MYTAGNLAASAIKAVGDKAKEAAKYVIEVGSRFEASMSKVAALSGASTTELSQMEEMAKPAIAAIEKGELVVSDHCL